MSKRKRGHGEGSIYRRKDGRWAASITLGYDAQGRQRKRTVYGKTRAEVAEKLTALLAEKQKGMLADPTRETVGEFLERWLRDVVAHSVRTKTLEAYTVAVKAHLIPGLGKIKLSKLTPAQITAFYRDRLDAGYAPKYVANIGATLHRALEVACRWGLIPQNPARLAERPKVEQKEFTVLTPAQVARLLDETKEHRLHALFVLLATSGLRLGEALGLTWDAVDVDQGCIFVGRQLQWAGKPLRPSLVPVKTARSRRRVPLAPMGVAALRQHRARQAEERLFLGPGWGGDYRDWNLVFTNEVGKPINPANFRNRVFYPALKRAGLPRVRPHDLRHFTATAMLHSGADYRQVMEYLGHSRPDVTIGLYAHTLPGSLNEAAARIERLLTTAADA